MNRATKARLIGELVNLKAKIALLDTDADLIVTKLKKVGGGESATWRAELVHIKAHDVHIKAHKQLRLYPKEAL